MTCQIPNCKHESAIIFYSYRVCDKHWSLHCDPNKSFDLKEKLKIKEASPQQILWV